MAKIVRKSLKVFGLTGDTADFAKFGSQEAAAPVKTKDIELIQSLEAWDKGWADAIVDANKAPYMEDMNAAMYVIGYELGYVLQEGIPEWDDGTTYYAESIVKKTTTQELYASKTNDNTNNALPNKVDNTDWKYLVDLDDIQVPDLSITTGKIAALAVTSGKIAAGAVTGAKIADGLIIAPGSAVKGLTIDQNYAAIGLDIDSSVAANANPAVRATAASTTNAAIEGYGVAAGIYGQGTNYDFSGPGPFTTKNGYVQARAEALAWDVVEINIDQTSPESVAYTLDGLKCKGLIAIGYDVSTDDIYSTHDFANEFYVRAGHDGTNLNIAYGSGYVNNDDLRAIVFTTA